MNETLEEIDFVRDRVIEMSFGYGFLIVCTATQCFIYNSQNWNTPHIFDLRTTVNLIVQSECHFITVDNFNGIQVYSYEGKLLCAPKLPGMHVEFLNRMTISLSNDTLSLLDHTDRKTIRSFDIYTGKQLPVALTHALEIHELALSHYGPVEDRKVFFIDRNRDLYIARVAHKGVHKLHAQVDTAAWNDSSEILIAIADAKLVLWSYPNMVHVDKTLLPDVMETRDGTDFLKMSAISSFVGSNVTVRRADGTVLLAHVAPYPAMLYEFTSTADWDKAVRLCRFVKEQAAVDVSRGHGRCTAGTSRRRDRASPPIDCVDKLYFVL
ncbi:hypothetical protein PINS_up019920 [Pythium insidiosum]|nr:hypothetical protein PINS_up019920 [Pythium insidiosum]